MEFIKYVYKTAIDVAAENGHNEITRFLTRKLKK